MANILARRASASQVASTSRPYAPVTLRGTGRRCNVRVNSGGNLGNFEKSMFGEDFGARDPTPGEIGSNFGEKIVMNWDTEHIIKPPDAIGKHIGLTSRKCQPAEAAQLLDDTRRERYRQQVPGWRVQNNAAGIQCIRQEWTAKDGQAAQQLMQQLQDLAQQQGHAITHTDAVGNTVFAELTTTAQGGLTENDFIVAAHINELNLSELLQKRKARYWA